MVRLNQMTLFNKENCRSDWRLDQINHMTSHSVAELPAKAVVVAMML